MLGVRWLIASSPLSTAATMARRHQQVRQFPMVPSLRVRKRVAKPCPAWQLGKAGAARRKQLASSEQQSSLASHTGSIIGSSDFQLVIGRMARRRACLPQPAGCAVRCRAQRLKFPAVDAVASQHVVQLVDHQQLPTLRSSARTSCSISGNRRRATDAYRDGNAT